MLILLLVFLVMSLVMALISIPLIARRVEPNLFYGFRVRRTLGNREVWFDVNEYFAWRLLVIGAVEALASIGFYAVPGISADAYALSVLAIFTVAFMMAMTQTVRYMNSLEK